MDMYWDEISQIIVSGQLWGRSPWSLVVTAGGIAFCSVVFAQGPFHRKWKELRVTEGAAVLAQSTRQWGIDRGRLNVIRLAALSFWAALIGTALMLLALLAPAPTSNHLCGSILFVVSLVTFIAQALIIRALFAVQEELQKTNTFTKAWDILIWECSIFSVCLMFLLFFMILVVVDAALALS